MSNLLSSLLLQEKFHSPILLYSSNTTFLEASAIQLSHDILRLSKNATTEKKIQSNQHPDLHILKPEGKADLYSVEMIQAFIEESSLPPFESRYKVYLFLQAERMLPVHANALLKTLEEKKPFTAIILTTTNLPAIIPTILSRCQKISLASLDDTPPTDPLIQKAIELSLSKEYSELFKTIELLEKQEVPLSHITTALLHHHRALLMNKQHLSTRPLEVIAKRIETAIEAQDRNIKSKHILEYLLT